MEEAKEYKEWCLNRGYKTSSTKALTEYYEEKKTKRMRLFRSKMSLYGDDTLDSLAEHLGIARQTLSKKINGEADFTQTEMSKIKIRYQLTYEEFSQIFTKESLQNESARCSEEVK